MKLVTLFVAGAWIAAPAHATDFTFDLYASLESPVPGDATASFDLVLSTPRMDNGTVMAAMGVQYPNESRVGLYTSTGNSVFERVVEQTDAMPDGVGTIGAFANEGFDIDGSTLLYSAQRSGQPDVAIVLRRNGVDEIVVDSNVTPLPGSPASVFTAVGLGDLIALDGESFVFEAEGSDGELGVYSYIDGSLAAVVSVGDVAPDWTPLGPFVTQPSLDNGNVAFASRSNGGATRGLFAIYEGTMREVAVTGMSPEGETATYTAAFGAHMDGAKVMYTAFFGDASNGVFRTDLSASTLVHESLARSGDVPPGLAGARFTRFGTVTSSMNGEFIVIGGFYTYDLAGGGQQSEDFGIFAWYDGELHNLIDITQTLDGKLISRFNIGTASLDGNQLAFEATFMDGSRGLYVATLQSDSDGDGVVDADDNCLTVANADQRDTDGDLYGNACDADLNNDGVVNVVDLGILRGAFFSADADADFNGDGTVNVVDLGIMRVGFFLPPGPSGLAD